MIREFVRLSLNERLRNELFRIKTLRDCEDAAEVQSYCRMTGLQEMGKGSSRTVYLLSSRKVLKVVGGSFKRDDIGRAQNKAERTLYDSMSQEFKQYVARVYESEPRNIWLISELVRPVKNKEEFCRLTGLVSRMNMNNVIQYVDNVGKRSWAKIEFYALPENVEKFQSFVNAIIHFREIGLLDQDLVPLEHWGVTTDQRIVLLDYGYNEETRKVYVGEKGQAAIDRLNTGKGKGDDFYYAMKADLDSRE